MFLVTLLILFFLLLLSQIEKKREGILKIYLLIWIVVTICCGLNSDTVDFDEKVYLLVILGSIGFCTGYLLLRFARGSFLCRSKQTNYVINQKIVLFLLWFSFGFSLLQAFKTILLLLSGVSWTMIRYKYVTMGLTMTHIESIINSWIVLPTINFVSLPIMLMQEKKDMKMVLLVILSGFLLFFATQGKETIIYWGLEMFFYYLLSGKKIGKKIKRKLVLAGFVFGVIIVGVKYSRTGRFSLGFIQEYAGIQFNLIDHWIDYIDNNNLNGNLGCFSAGLLNVPFSVLKIIGIEAPRNISDIYDNIMYMISTGVIVTPNGRPDTNVYITHLVSFYYDFREIGVFFENVIFGMLVGFVSKWCSSKRITPFYSIIFILVATGTCCSIIYWLPTMTPYILSIIYVRLCYRGRKVDEYKSIHYSANL